MTLLSQIATLVFLSRLHPEASDASKPHTHFIPENARNLMASAIIKAIAQKVTDTNASEALHATGKNLFESGIKAMDYDDDYWPLHPKPYYHEGQINFKIHSELSFSISVGEEVLLNPQPLPPHEQKYYGALLTMLADAISADQVAATLRSTGLFLMKQSNSNYEKNLSFSEI